MPYALSAENALLLKSDDGTQWSLECDNDGTLKAVAIPERFTKLVFSDEFDGTGLLDDSKWNNIIRWLVKKMPIWPTAVCTSCAATTAP